jgi:hypothetical protein
VVNDTQTRRIHLTMDTYGSTEFWDLAQPWNGPTAEPRFVPYREGAAPNLLYETFVGDPVMSPAEIELELSALVADAAAHPESPLPELEQLRAFVASLQNEWRTIWHLKGPTQEGLAHFAPLARWAQSKAAGLSPLLKTASNGNALAPSLADTFRVLIRETLPVRGPASAKAREPRFDRPVFIVSAPRSGSTWLYEMLAQNPAFQTLGGEGHQHVEAIEALQPRRRDFHSNRLTAADATPQIGAQLRANYLATLRDASGQLLLNQSPAPAAFRFLEKTPKNALRIPFLKALFPDAKFIFLHREPRANISAIMEAWRSGRFVTYPGLPAWPGQPWSLLLIRGWRDLIGSALERIAMRQWVETNETILDDLQALPATDWCAVAYEDLKRQAESELRKLCDFAQVPFDQSMRRAAAGGDRPSRYTLTPPDPQKWRKNEAAIEAVIGETDLLRERLGALTSAPRELTPAG